VLRLVNRRQLGTGDFERQRIDVEEILAEEEEAGIPAAPAMEEQTGIYLNATGRKIFLKEYFARLRETM
jgi:hypothetical protein